MTTSEKCTLVEDYIKKFYLPAMYLLILIVGLAGNATAIIIYLVKLRPWKSSSIIIVNLAVTDLLYTLSMPFLVHFYITGNWTLGELMCRFVRFCFHFNLYGSILFLTCLSVFRYVVVVHPLRAAQVQRKCWGLLACLGVWVITLVEISPMLTMITTEQTNNTTLCLDFASNNPSQIWWYSWLLTVLGYVVPLVVVFWSCTSIMHALAQGANVGRPSRVRARRLSMLILVVFVVCFLPYHMLRALRVNSLRAGSAVACWEKCAINTAYTVSRPLAGLNTFFNLALFTLAGDRVHQAVHSLMRTRVHSSSSVAVIYGD
ncbi:2-oxoglutarate receptor 1 [Chanos chanos]|uniref:2-oxoglutarate receptor 1 n=1 Tax=Chanos chanos TaxID=29144 RepID=A0A6J2WGR0_CHACN|nr:2-oxoglutarate receptor 1-like [Chanos chanos]